MDLVGPRPVQSGQGHLRHAVQSHDSDRLAPLSQALTDFGGECALACGDRADNDDQHRLSLNHEIDVGLQIATIRVRGVVHRCQPRVPELLFDQMTAKHWATSAGAASG